ncbi:RNA recognition motif domain [Macleaya cordata]|uniref:RNA recognition motif domain n=1 Tax=Macleaya cordata TaxID=56857 RepID=A0A200QBS1_MACCD|nr:RNA recognition motif domain [Macleaya cordata]
MASSQQPTVGSSCPTAQIIGNAFVHQYYHILHQSPELVFRFYQDSSKLGRPEPKGTMSSVTTMQAINEKILSLEYSDYTAEIKTVDAQESLNGGVLVLVTGYLTGKDNVKRNFTQSFFLAPQDKGYFVLNDIFRYVEGVEYHEVNEGLANGVAAPLIPEQESAPAPEQQVFEQPASLPDVEVNVEEVYNPSDNEDGSVVEEETPVAEVVDEVQNDLQIVSESTSSALEDTPKKSYASIVKVMKESPAPLSVPKPAAARPAPESNERQMASAPPPAPSAETPVPGPNVAESGSAVEGEADGYSIYIRSLPLNATPDQLEEEFKRFGPIKSGGIQVRSNKQQGFCFGFVEFEAASAVQSAIEASPISIGGRQAHVEEKRPSGSRVNNRNRFPPGRGSGSGFRNDGARGRGGNYGSGRGYGRTDFNNRSEFNNRGGGGGGGGSRGASGRATDGVYQRVDQLGGNNTGRMNRSSGMATKAVTQRLPAPA